VSPNFTLQLGACDTVYLSEADAGGKSHRYRAQVIFGAAENGVSIRALRQQPDECGFRRDGAAHVGADNPTSVTQFRTGTGLANSAAEDRADCNQRNQLSTGRRRWNESRRERGRRVHRLANITSAAVPLFDPARPTNIGNSAAA
jgi:hypothetical protein